MIDSLYRQAFELIKQYDSIVIFGHINPDGDCYGSEIGLKAFLKETFPYKNIYAVGSGFKKALNYFNDLDLVSDDVIKNSLGIIVDVSDLERIEDQRVVSCLDVIKFDHHLLSETKSFGSINISNNNATSVCEMIGSFILANGYNISPSVGEKLYLGLVTDSGRFLYLNDKADIFKVADAILKSGADIKSIYNWLYESDIIQTKAKGYISYNFEVKDKVAYIVLRKETLKLLNVDYNLASTMVNCMANLENIEAWVSFSESDEGRTRVEIRSKNVDVQQVAVFFNGGGHKNASGCSLNDINDYIKVVDKLNEVIFDVSK